MNEHNLIPITERTKSEQREIRQKGGIKSGEVRRRKRNLKAAMKSLLALPVQDINQWNAISELGVDSADIDNQTAIACALMSKAMAGDVAAFREIRSLLGEDNDAERVKLQKKQVALQEKKLSQDIGGEERCEVKIVDDIDGNQAF